MGVPRSRRTSLAALLAALALPATAGAATAGGQWSGTLTYSTSTAVGDVTRELSATLVTAGAPTTNDHGWAMYPATGSGHHAHREVSGSPECRSTEVRSGSGLEGWPDGPPEIGVRPVRLLNGTLHFAVGADATVPWTSTVTDCTGTFSGSGGATIQVSTGELAVTAGPAGAFAASGPTGYGPDYEVAGRLVQVGGFDVFEGTWTTRSGGVPNETMTWALRCPAGACVDRGGARDGDGPPARRGHDVGLVCGTARFDFHVLNATSRGDFVKKGERACLLAVSNRTTKELARTGGTLSAAIVSSFGAEIALQLGDAAAQRTAQQRLDRQGRRLLARLLPQVARGVRTARLMDRAGLAAAALMVPYAAATHLKHVTRYNACTRLILDVDGRRLKVGGGVLYSPKGLERPARDAHMTRHSVWRKQSRRLRPDTYTRVLSSLRCDDTGMIRVTGGDAKLFRNPTRVLLRAPDALAGP